MGLFIGTVLFILVISYPIYIVYDYYRTAQIKEDVVRNSGYRDAKAYVQQVQKVTKVEKQSVVTPRESRIDKFEIPRTELNYTVKYNPELK